MVARWAHNPKVTAFDSRICHLINIKSDRHLFGSKVYLQTFLVKVLDTFKTVNYNIYIG